MITETREEIAERLSVRIYNALTTSPVPSPKMIGQLGAVLWPDDDDVRALRGKSDAVLPMGELPFLIAQALPLLNDPRILNVTVDGTTKDSEVMIDVVCDDDLGVPTTYTITSNGGIDAETTGLDEDHDV